MGHSRLQMARWLSVMLAAMLCMRCVGEEGGSDIGDELATCQAELYEPETFVGSGQADYLPKLPGAVVVALTSIPAESFEATLTSVDTIEPAASSCVTRSNGEGICSEASTFIELTAGSTSIQFAVSIPIELLDAAPIGEQVGVRWADPLVAESEGHGELHIALDSGEPWLSIVAQLANPTEPPPRWQIGSFGIQPGPSYCAIPRDSCLRVLHLEDLSIDGTSGTSVVPPGEQATLTEAGVEYHVEHLRSYRRVPNTPGECTDLTFSVIDFWIVRSTE